MEQRRVGRPCLVCSRGTSERASIEEALLDGFSIARVARDFQIGPDSIRRHVERHLAPEARRAIQVASDGLSPVSIARRVRAVADAARGARETAYANGQTLALLGGLFSALDTEERRQYDQARGGAPRSG